LLELLDVDLPLDLFVQGANLIPLLRGKMDNLRDFSFSSARSTTNRFHDRKYRLDLDRRIHSVRSDRWKLIKYPGLQDTKDNWDFFANVILGYLWTINKFKITSIKESHKRLQIGYLAS